MRVYCPGRPPLYYAIDFEMGNPVEILIKKPTDINMLVQERLPLHFAARCGALSIVKLLILHEVNFNLPSSRDTKSITSLHFAAEGGYEQIIKLVLNHNALCSLGTPLNQRHSTQLRGLEHSMESRYCTTRAVSWMQRRGTTGKLFRNHLIKEVHGLQLNPWSGESM